MKKVLLNIKTVQNVNGEDDVTEFSSEGKYSHTVLGTEILYDESVILGVESVKTRLTVSKDGTVSIVRNEGNYGNIVIKKEKRNLCRLYTEYGPLVIGVYGNRVKDELNEHGGKILLDYAIDVNSNHLSRNKVEITVREEIK